MKYKLFFLCSFFFLLNICVSSQVFAGTSNSNKVPEGETEKYTKLWAQVDSLDNKGLRRSAYDLSVEIFTMAKADEDAAEIVKAMIHRLKFQDYTEEDAMLKNLRDLEAETKLANFPAKPLMHSMLGEMYWGYYQNNRYRFLERSETVGIDENDPATWDLHKIVKTCQAHFSLSMSDEQLSKKTPVDLFDPVLINDGAKEPRKFRKTLYDFLAHRALDFYVSTESGLTQPAETFRMDDPIFLTDFDSFLKFHIPKTDTTDFKYKACLIFQELISFHLHDNDPDELIDIEMQRFDFVRESMTIDEKDSLYEHALIHLAGKFPVNSITSEVFYKLAELYEQKGNLYNPEISELHKWDLNKAFQYCDTVIHKYPGSRGATLCANLKTRIQIHSLSFITENINPMGREFRARIEYKNVNKLFCRIIRDGTDKLPDQKRYGDELIQYLLQAEVLKSWSVVLPPDSDKQNHSVEIALPGLDYGKFYLVISDREDFLFPNSLYAYGSFRISDLSLLSRNMEGGTYEFFVLDRITGAPVNRVSVEVTTNQYNRASNSYDTVIVANYLSDKNGRFEVSPSKDQGHEAQRRNLLVVFGTQKVRDCPSCGIWSRV